MPHSIWKGAISFGLVHIPVALVSATSSEHIDFDWLDERSMDPVGYKRVNKITGKEVSKEHIVKGIEYEKGQYVILSEEEIRTAHPKSTQAIDIFSFVERTDIPLVNIDTPYYLAPDKRGEKVYALLRETLASTQKVALANVILHTRQRLAVLMPIDDFLVLILLRWPAEVRDFSSLEINSSTLNPALTKSEKDMARRLVQDMAAKWEPDEYRDSFQEKIRALVEKKANEGKIESVEADPGKEERKSADIIDLTELLKRSLGGATKIRTASKDSGHTSSSKSTAAKKSATTKTPTRQVKKSKAAKTAAGKPAKSVTAKPVVKKSSR